MSRAIVTEAGEVLFDDPERCIIRFIVVDQDTSIFRYSVADLAAYYEGDPDAFNEIIAALQDQGFWKRYDDEAGVSVFGVDDFAVFQQQLSELSVQ
jgi:hypothetical protein